MKNKTNERELDKISKRPFAVYNVCGYCQADIDKCYCYPCRCICHDGGARSCSVCTPCKNPPTEDNTDI